MRNTYLFPTLLLASFALSVSACDGDDGDTSSDSGEAADTSSSTDSTSDTGTEESGEETGGSASGCDATCANVDACGPESYDAAPAYEDLASCLSVCESNYATLEAAGCGAEQVAMNACVAALSCEDLVAFVTDPLASGVCADEVSALGACG